MKATLIRGLPSRVQQDGWWLSDSAGPARRKAGDTAIEAKRAGLRLALLVALILLGDVLVWQVMPGVSLAVFCAALVTAALTLNARRLQARRIALVLGLAILSLLPLVELVQPLSVLLAAVGLSLALVLTAGVSGQNMAWAALRLWPLGMMQTARDAAAVADIGTGRDIQGFARRFVMAWLFPLLMGAVFLMLLTGANPIFDRWVQSLGSLEPPRFDRFGFWLALAPFCWAVLSLPALQERLKLPRAPRAGLIGPRRPGLINAASILRALILFNAVFAVQTVLDVIYLYAGATLPEGITYAAYAHRGAYPLVLTALLAGAFTLAARRWTDDAPLMRLGLILFIAQNIALVVSAAVRLEIYIDVYGLTRLRMSALIWMALTAAGLSLTLWQIWSRKDNGWLLIRCAILGFGVLWLSSLISFDAAIARHNLAKGHISDRSYLCTLGEAATPAIIAHNRARRMRVCFGSPPRVFNPRGWREWGFRNWRVRTSLAAIHAEGRP